MESRAELEERGDASLNLDRAARRLRRAGHELEQRRLPRSVRADDAEGLTRLDGERHVLQRLDGDRRRVLAERPLLERAAALAAHAIRLRRMVRSYGGHGSKSDRRSLSGARATVDRRRLRGTVDQRKL